MKMSKAIITGSVVVACIIIFSGLLMLIPTETEIENVDCNWWTGKCTITYSTVRPYVNYCWMLFWVGVAVGVTGFVISAGVEAKEKIKEMKSNVK